jgi:hypothetical protein
VFKIKNISLLLDKCNVRPQRKNCLRIEKVLFLPSNGISFFQSFNLELIWSFKHHFTRKLVMAYKKFLQDARLRNAYSIGYISFHGSLSSVSPVLSPQNDLRNGIPITSIASRQMIIENKVELDDALDDG